MKYAFKHFFRDKNTLFWNLIFPIILLGILINIFSFKAVTVNFSCKNENCTKFLTSFNQFKYINTTDYIKALNDNRIDVFIDEHGNIISKSDSEAVNMVKSIMDIGKRFEKDPRAMSMVFEKQKSTDNSEKNLFNQMIFSIFIMTTFYTSFAGMAVTRILNPRNNFFAQRILISPQKTFKTLFNASISNIILSIIPVVVSVIFAVYVFGFNGITNYLSTAFLLIIGIFFGFSFGLFIGSFNIDESKMNGIILTYMLIMSFFSGMSGTNLLTLTLKRAKWLLKINPLYIMTKNLTLSNGLENYNINLTELSGIIAISILLILISTFILGRKRYDSI